MTGRVVVVGSQELCQKIQPLAPVGLAVVHIKSTQGLSAQIRQHQPALIFLTIEGDTIADEVNEFLDRSDEGEAFLYLLTSHYDLAQAEAMLMGHRRVVRYVAIDMMDEPHIQEEMRQYLAAAHERSQATLPGEHKPVGWVLKVKAEDYEEQRLVSLFIGEMGEFILKLKAIVYDLRKEWRRFSFPNAFQHISAAQQLDDWYRWVLFEEEPRDKREAEWRQKFEDRKRKNAYRLFQQSRLRGFKPATILIRGETGTGKSLVVKLLHKWLFGDSNTPFDTVMDKHPFQELNCIGIPDTLLESELFGALAGSHTDRSTTSPGKIIPAYGGTLFLDEIGDMSVELQGKLLKFLDDSRVSPLGWISEGIFVPLHIIAATNADLEAKIREKTFREDLYYRLCSHELTIPPLKDRLWDLERMVDFILQNPRTNQDATGKWYVHYVHEEALAKLKDYEFKGNFRELESILQEAILQVRLEGMEMLLERHIVLPVEELPSGQPGAD